ncbi:hypothetical protein SS50377_23419 [Spironucleus salmonicida]|uniref:Uncharacterized protein n=1 Tax=Spironucleus salmonicida TaxID=348837 RepID=V6LNG3_9EUKA|nr:hypothetical protein SS50377_23419 [Spironucleus salmonicida]|eukprot:EST46155.1 Hypothetical protein SS50377_13747 [Spironucleus salmonicida]
MDKAIKAFSHALETRNEAINDTIQGLIQASYTDPLAPQKYSQFKITEDLLQQDNVQVYELLSNLLEQSSQLISLKFSSKNEQKIIFRQAVSKLSGQKLCLYFIALIEEINITLEQKQICLSQLQTLNLELQNLKDLKKQGMVELPESIQGNEDDIPDDIEPIFKDNSSEISCVLTSSSEIQYEIQQVDKNIDSLLIKTKIRISEISEKITQLMIEQKEEQSKLNIYLQFLQNILSSQLDILQLKLFLNYIIDECQFIDIIEILLYLTQKGFIINNFMIIIISSLVQMSTSLQYNIKGINDVLNDILNYTPIKKFSFTLNDKLIKIQKVQPKNIQHDNTIFQNEYKFSKYSTLLPSQVNQKDLRFHNAYRLKFKNQLRINTDDKFISNIQLDTVDKIQKKQPSTKIESASVKCTFNFLSNAPFSINSQNVFCNQNIILYMNLISNQLQDISNFCCQLFQYRFQSIASCSRDYDTQGQKLISTSLTFSFITVVIFFMNQITENITIINQIDFKFDQLFQTFYTAYREIMQFLEMLTNIQGEFQQQKYEYQHFLVKALQFLNVFAKLTYVLKGYSGKLKTKLQSKIQILKMQENMLTYSKNNNNPMQISLEIVQNQLQNLQNEIQTISDFNLKIQNLINNNIELICSSHCIFQFIPKFLQQFQIISQCEMFCTQQYLEMIQTICLLYQSFDDQVYQLKEGMKKQSDKIDRIIDEISQDEEEDIFEVDSTRDQIFLSLLYNGKIVDQLIYFVERIIFGPLVLKQEAVEIICIVLQFIVGQNAKLEEKIFIPICIESFVSIEKILGYKGDLLLQELSNYLINLLETHYKEISSGDQLKVFHSIFVSQNVNTKPLQQQLNQELNILRDYQITGNNDSIPASITNQIIQQKPESIKNEDQLQQINQLSSFSLSDTYQISDFTKKQDVQLINEYAQLLIQFGQSIAISKLTERLDFQFSQSQIETRIQELRNNNQFSKWEIQEIQSLLQKDRAVYQVTQLFQLSQQQITYIQSIIPE